MTCATADIRSQELDKYFYDVALTTGGAQLLRRLDQLGVIVVSSFNYKDFRTQRSSQRSRCSVV